MCGSFFFSNSFGEGLAFRHGLDNAVAVNDGVPFDHAVIVTVEQTDGTILAMDPDDDENTELLEIMAGALAKYLGEDLKLKRTPQVLTIEGDLRQATIRGDVGNSRQLVLLSIQACGVAVATVSQCAALIDVTRGTYAQVSVQILEVVRVADVGVINFRQ